MWHIQNNIFEYLQHQLLKVYSAKKVTATLSLGLCIQENIQEQV